MKDNKNIRKVLYLSKHDIALIVLEEHNVLFADQVSIDFVDLQVKVNELLTNAANFLGFNIKDVEVIFNDQNITKYSYTNQEFVDCTCESDIAKEIFKKAKIDNYFVNEINFMGVEYDEIDKVAKVNCEVCASDYITYKQYIKAIGGCNVVITNSTNIYKLLKPNKEQIELLIKIENDQAIACEYYGNKLNNVKVIDLEVNEIKRHISEKFKITPNKMEDVLALANDVANDDELDINIVNNYDLKIKSFNNVNSKELIALYRDEIRTQISNYVDLRNFQSVSVVSNNKLNKLEGFEFVCNDDVALDNLSIDKILCLANLDCNKEEINQFSFENQIKGFQLA